MAHWRTLIVGGVVAGMSALGAASPAEAEPVSTDSPVCWVAFNSDTVRCFSSAADMLASIQSVTGHALVTPIAGLASGAATAGAVNPATAYALATIYEDQNYGGASLLLTDTHSQTCSAYNYTFNTMPSGWNDRISSFQSYGTCKTRLSVNTNQGGASVGPVANLSYVGATLNDQASSMFITN